MFTLTTEQRIKKLQKKLGEVVGVHQLNAEKYRVEVNKGMPQQTFKVISNLEREAYAIKSLDDYLDNLCRTIVNAMVEAKLDVRIELPKLRDAGLMSPDFFIFAVLASFDPEQSKRCHAYLVAESTNLIQ